jgi:hypothetical protein
VVDFVAAAFGPEGMRGLRTTPGPRRLPPGVTNGLRGCLVLGRFLLRSETIVMPLRPDFLLLSAAVLFFAAGAGFDAALDLTAGFLLAGAFFEAGFFEAGFFAGAFFEAVFLEAAFFVAVFLVAAFFAGVFLEAVFFFAGLLLAGFIVAAFFAVFLVAVFFVVDFFAVVFLAAVFFPVEAARDDVRGFAAAGRFAVFFVVFLAKKPPAYRRLSEGRENRGSGDKSIRGRDRSQRTAIPQHRTGAGFVFSFVLCGGCPRSPRARGGRRPGLPR